MRKVLIDIYIADGEAVVHRVAERCFEVLDQKRLLALVQEAYEELDH